MRCRRQNVSSYIATSSKNSIIIIDLNKNRTFKLGTVLAVFNDVMKTKFCQASYGCK